MKRKGLVGTVVWISILLIMGLIYIYTPDSFSTVEKRVEDLFFMNRKPIKPLGEVIIVDIDEKSLASLGQWPWERDILSDLLNKLHQYGAGIIGLDIVFPEVDKTSPSYINKKMDLNLTSTIDYDMLFAKTLANTPTIAGFIFDMEHPTSTNKVPEIPAIIIEKKRSDISTIYQAKGVISNIDLLQEHTYSSGFFNIIPDKSGIIRKAPMLIRYNEILYPSLTLEMIRVMMQEDKIIVQYDENGVEYLKIGNLKIPVDEKGALSINFRGGRATFPYISAIDILQNKISSDQLKNKIILIGTSAGGLLDLRAIPLASVIPGVEIHANIIDNILTQDFLTHPKWTIGVDLLIFIIIYTLAFFIFLSLGAGWLSIAVLLLFIVAYYFVEWMLFHEGLLINTVFPFFALLTALISAIFIDYFFESKQKKLIRNTFMKKVSASVVQELMQHADQGVMKNREEEVTILFSDIREFTTLSEKIDSPQNLIALLNTYISPMSDIILEHQGTIDKYIGDAIMAYWNAPQHVDDHPDKAVTSALQQLEKLKLLNIKIKEHFGITLEIGIGIHTGLAIVGEIGSSDRSDYTIIGDSVNLTSRLESLNKIYGTSLIISEQTKQLLKKTYLIRELGQVRVKGKSKSIRIYEVLDQTEDRTTEFTIYHDALKYYYNKDFKMAYGLFTKLYQEHSHKLYYYYKEQSQFYLNHPDKATLFDGIHHIDMK